MSALSKTIGALVVVEADGGETALVLRKSGEEIRVGRGRRTNLVDLNLVEPVIKLVCDETRLVVRPRTSLVSKGKANLGGDLDREGLHDRLES